jgi:NADPH:quinone reductase-like Zn-dependent oxidoreductase
MKAVYITKHGPPDVLQLRDALDPEPGPGEIRIAVRAAGINFADTMLRIGLYPTDRKLPLCPASKPRALSIAWVLV